MKLSDKPEDILGSSGSSPSERGRLGTEKEMVKQARINPADGVHLTPKMYQVSSVSASCCCSQKFSGNKHMSYSSRSQKSKTGLMGLKSKCRQSCVPVQKLSGEPSLLPFLVYGRCPLPVAHSPLLSLSATLSPKSQRLGFFLLMMPSLWF